MTSSQSGPTLATSVTDAQNSAGAPLLSLGRPPENLGKEIFQVPVEDSGGYPESVSGRLFFFVSQFIVGLAPLPLPFLSSLLTPAGEQTLSLPARSPLTKPDNAAAKCIQTSPPISLPPSSDTRCVFRASARSSVITNPSPELILSADEALLERRATFTLVTQVDATKRLRHPCNWFARRSRAESLPSRDLATFRHY
ncbi:hypothetical protein G7046_g6671 [Stylonectria norvegica]|nr:hypothetical protein G7046_g6671 [Stylonectria norvegica]